jgi:prepilin-type processing-associated H-X9-DG protein
MASNLYAQESKEYLWIDKVDKDGKYVPFSVVRNHSSLLTAWARLPDTTDPAKQKLSQGLVYKYLDNVDKVSECPTNKRRSVTGKKTATTSLSSEIDFDFTFVFNVSGARQGVQPRIAYPEPTRYNSLFIKPPNNINTNSEKMNLLQGVPVFVEEASYGNSSNADGLFAARDTFSRRHSGQGNIAFFDGSAGGLATPNPGPEDKPAVGGEFKANLFYVQTTRWWLNFEGREGEGRPFGWINNPI